MSYPEEWLARLNELIVANNIKGYLLCNEQLAKGLGLSKRHFSRKVKALTGMSPKQYLTNVRMKKAMAYLTSGDYKTVKETAHAVGFINVSHFITTFEKKYGQTPFQVLKEYGWR